jgi:hypothetical protein
VAGFVPAISGLYPVRRGTEYAARLWAAVPGLPEHMRPFVIFYGPSGEMISIQQGPAFVETAQLGLDSDRVLSPQPRRGRLCRSRSGRHRRPGGPLPRRRLPDPLDSLPVPVDESAPAPGPAVTASPSAASPSSRWARDRRATAPGRSSYPEPDRPPRCPRRLPPDAYAWAPPPPQSPPAGPQSQHQDHGPDRHHERDQQAAPLG